ncbi:MAG: peptidoglycan DD-metalloendopeptidase family protein [Bacteriovorax sp.]|nr:peptidoglycan DD-metalloendopeptidase family protein [Bacteriovorax sp.]
MNFKTIILLCLLPLVLPMALSAAVETDEKLNIFAMKKKLLTQNKMIQEMSHEVSKVEMNLGMQNKKYLRLADERAKIEESLSSARKNADLDNQNLKKNYYETKMILMGVLLNKLEKAESSSDLLSRKILVENLQRRLLDLDGMMKTNKAVQDDVERLYLRLEDSMRTEKELLSMMSELEQRKKDLHANIESSNLKKSDAQNHFDEMKNKMAMERESLHKSQLKEKLMPVQITEEIKIPSQAAQGSSATSRVSVAGADFFPPISLYQGIDYQKKGVTFNFQGKNEVRAPKAGKVVYTGSLASYGNVLMIDHGNDTRTVLLGQFDYNVKNGDPIQAAQLVGYTNPRSHNGLGDGKIYFEVRKNNLAQNTYLLLDKKILARNSSK